MAMPTKKDHATEAFSRLSHQFKDKPNLVALLAIFTKQFDQLESAIYALFVERMIYTAVGAQLDQIGAIIGQPRQGLDDETYRQYILARIAANKSDGLVEDLIGVARLVINDPDTSIQVLNQSIASVVVRVLGDLVPWETAKVVIELLRQSVTGGVRALLEFVTYPVVSITKTGGIGTWNAGASSVGKITGNGYVQVKVSGGNTQACGLSEADANVDYTSIKYGIYFTTGGAQAIESGTLVGTVQSESTTTDVWRVRRTGTVVTYERNGVVFYTSLVPSSASLLVDVSLATAAAAFTDVRFDDAGQRKAITWQNVVNVSITPIDPPAYSKRFRFSDATIYNAAATGHPQTAASTKTAAAGYGTWSAGWLMDALSGNLPAVFGSPTLTFSNANANMSPKYNCPGVRGLSDKAIELIAGGANIFTGDTSLAISSTEDLAFIVTGTQLNSPFAACNLLSKGDTAGGTNRWQLAITNVGTDKVLWQFVHTDATVTNTTATLPIGKPCVVVCVLERATGKIRAGVRSVDGTHESISAEVTVPANAYGSTNNFILGANLGLDGADRFQISSMYVAKGSGAATGMSANISAALVSFCNTINAWPYVLPNYGQGGEDANDKYAASLTALRSQLIAGTIVDVGSTLGITWFDCNESSGNLSPKFGSTPASMTTAGTPVYGVPGPRGGNDKAIEFNSTTDAFGGGAVHDIGANELFLIVVGRWTTIPSAFGVVASKVAAANASGWSVFTNNGTSWGFDCIDGAGEKASTISNYHLGKWLVAIAIVDRSTGKARFGVRTLDGTETLGAEATITGSITTAANFVLGNSAWVGAPITFQIAGFGITTGTNVAYGTSANLSAILSRYATAMNRYYGGHLSAAME